MRFRRKISNCSNNRMRSPRKSPADREQIDRLQGAIKYTVNSDLVFTPGGWEMSAQGKQIIANMAKKLAPTQRNKIR